MCRLRERSSIPGTTRNVTPASVSRSESGVTTRASAESRGSRTTAIAHCRVSVRRVPRRAISEMCRRDRWSSMRLSKSLSAPSPMRCVDRRSRSDAVRTRIGELCRVSRRAICRRCRARLPTSHLALVAPASATRVVCGRDVTRISETRRHTRAFRSPLLQSRPTPIARRESGRAAPSRVMPPTVSRVRGSARCDVGSRFLGGASH